MIKPYLDGNGNATTNHGGRYFEQAVLDAYVTRLDKEGFTVHTAEGATVSVGDPMVTWDPDAVQAEFKNGVLTVTPPSHRFDLQIEEDLIEEVIKVLGYTQLPDTPPLAPRSPYSAAKAGSDLIALAYLGSPDVGLMVSTYLGFWLTGVLFCSIGMLGSMLSKNSAVAFVLGFLGCGAADFRICTGAQTASQVCTQLNAFSRIVFSQ